MKLHIPDFTKARVLVVGDLMLDRYWQGATSRISPEAPVPIVRVDQHEDRPGGAGNVAVNIAVIGGKVKVDGIIGDDEAGALLARLLEADQVSCCFAPLTGIRTITKLRVLSRHQQLIRLDFEDELDTLPDKDLLARFATELDDCDVVLLSDYAKGTLSSVSQMIKLAKEAAKPVLVDPKGSDFARYHGATLLTPNLAEFEAVVGRCADVEQLVAKGEALRDQLALQGLLITRSEQGVTLLQAGQPPLHIPAQAREVFDVTGAGDTIISVLAAALAAGEPLEMATALANLAAGIVVGKLGAVAVTVDELRSALVSSHPPTVSKQSGVLDEEALLEVARHARALGERVVMTNGCFDILHAGHVTYLEHARSLGDRLIVAVNDDASVTKLKGPGRPVNPLSQRMKVLAALKSVDWVVPFSEDTPERLICRLLPDVLVKGGDYQVEQIAGHQCVKENGGEVQVLGYEEGCSTTDIIDSIRGHRGK